MTGLGVIEKFPATNCCREFLYIGNTAYFTESMCAIKSNTLFE